MCMYTHIYIERFLTVKKGQYKYEKRENWNKFRVVSEN